MKYRVSDIVIESAIELPELLEAGGSEPACVIEQADGADPDEVPGPWIHHWRQEDGSVWLSCAKREGGGYLLRFPDLADFEIAPDGCRIRCRPRPATPAHSIAHLLLDQVIPLWLSVGGTPVLHASAVAVDAGAVVFLGEAGSGKSTLTARFCFDGFPLVADDYLVVRERVGQWIGVPSYPGLRLWPDTLVALDVAGFSRPVAHYSPKRRVRIEGERFCAAPAPLRRLYVMAAGEASDPITIAPVPARDAIMALVAHGARLDPSDADALRVEFDRLSRLAAALPIRRLVLPGDLDRLVDVRDAVLEDLRRG